MMGNSNSFISRHWIASSSALFFVFYVLLGLQGLPSVDDGFVLVAYQNMFSDVSQASYLFDRYSTAFVGGLWHVFFGWGGVFSFRILAAIFIVASYILVCYIIKDYWKTTSLIRCVVLAFFVVITSVYHRYGTMVFHYMTLSAFNSCLFSFLFLRAINGSSKYCKLFLISSGIVLGWNIFARIPNIILCGIPYICLTIAFFYHHDKKKLLRQAGIFTSGLTVGIISVILFMQVLGHWDLFINCLGNLSETAKDSNDSHSIFSLINRMVGHLMLAKDYSLLVLIIFGAAIYFSEKIKSRNIKTLLIVALWILLIAFLWIPFFHVIYKSALFDIDVETMAILYGFMLCMAGTSIVITRERTVVIPVLLSVLFLVFQPIGSDGYLGYMGQYSIWVSLPLLTTSFVYALNIRDSIVYRQRKLIYALLLSAFLLGPYNITTFNKCFYDNGSRLYKTHHIEESRLATFYTSFENKNEIGGLFRELKKYVNEGDYVLFGIDRPMFYYLTNTKPFISHPWACVLSGKVFENKIANALRERALPVVVEYVDNRGRGDSMYLQSKDVLQNFLLSREYNLVYENLSYRIYLPPG